MPRTAKLSHKSMRKIITLVIAVFAYGVLYMGIHPTNTRKSSVTISSVTSAFEHYTVEKFKHRKLKTNI
jgi:hypothetical protein